MKKDHQYPLVKMGDDGSIFLSFYSYPPQAKATKEGMQVWLEVAVVADMARLWFHSMNGYCGILRVETYYIDWCGPDEAWRW